MRYPLSALVLGASLLAGSAISSMAWADTVYTVSKVTITGNKSVPTAQLMAVVKEHRGQKVTVNDIIADRDAISKVLEAANVGGSVNPSVKTTGATSEIIFAIQDQGVQAPIVTKVNPKLDAESFVGNVAISSDALTTASGLKPGDELTNEKIAAAQKGIVAAYSALKTPVNANVSGQNSRLPNGNYDVVWHITESKAVPAKKKSDSGDSSDSNQ